MSKYLQTEFTTLCSINDHLQCDTLRFACDCTIGSLCCRCSLFNMVKCLTKTDLITNRIRTSSILASRGTAKFFCSALWHNYVKVEPIRKASHFCASHFIFLNFNNVEFHFYSIWQELLLLFSVHKRGFVFILKSRDIIGYINHGFTQLPLLCICLISSDRNQLEISLRKYSKNKKVICKGFVLTSSLSENFVCAAKAEDRKIKTKL